MNKYKIIQELYRKAIFVLNSYHDFQNPSQDNLETIENHTFIFIPLNINLNLRYNNKKVKLER